LYSKSTNSLLQTILTNGHGEYEFLNLTPDTYFCQVSLPSGSSGQSFVTPNHGNDEWLDSDVNALGVSDSFLVVQQPPQKNNPAPGAGQKAAPVDFSKITKFEFAEAIKHAKQKELTIRGDNGMTIDNKTNNFTYSISGGHVLASQPGKEKQDFIVAAGLLGNPKATVELTFAKVYDLAAVNDRKKKPYVVTYTVTSDYKKTAAGTNLVVEPGASNKKSYFPDEFSDNDLKSAMTSAFIHALANTKIIEVPIGSKKGTLEGATTVGNFDSFALFANWEIKKNTIDTIIFTRAFPKK
jgi:SdrD B-like domain